MIGEELKAWAMSLKPGDKAIVKYWRGVDIAIVQKVTPSGRVNTNKGVFALSKWGDWYEGYGKTSGYLYPATPELIAEAERQEREREEEYRRNAVLRKAIDTAYKLRYGEIRMTYDLAVDLIALVEKHAGKEAVQ